MAPNIAPASPFLLHGHLPGRVELFVSHLARRYYPTMSKLGVVEIFDEMRTDNCLDPGSPSLLRFWEI